MDTELEPIYINEYGEPVYCTAKTNHDGHFELWVAKSVSRDTIDLDLQLLKQMVIEWTES